MPKAKEFTPDYAVHPGKTLEECVSSAGWTLCLFADRTGIPQEQIEAILDGAESITEEIAARLEKTLGVPAKFWMNYQREYDETVARLSKGDKEGE